MAYCCVVGCSSTKARGSKDLILYTFPGKPYEKELRQRWIDAVKRVNPDGTPWKPTKSARICNLHFVGGKRSREEKHPAYVPSIFPHSRGKRSSALADARKLNRYKRWFKRRKPPVPVDETSQSDVTEEDLSSAVIVIQDFDSTGVQTDFEEEPGTFEFTCDRISDTCVAVQCDIPQNQSAIPQNPIPRDPPTLVDVACGPSNPDEPCRGFHGISSIRDERDLKGLCGVGWDGFDFLLSFLTYPLSLLLKNQNVLLLFLMKIKLGISFTSLGVLLNVHRTTASNLFLATLRILSSGTTKHDIVWPERFELLNALPPCFKGTEYENTRAIIDCVEVRVDKPEDVDDRVAMYSKASKGYTFKFLIGVSPLGLVSFKSELFGGKSSDDHVVTHSGILQMLEPGDVVLADRGFPDVDASTAGAKIVVPPFLRQGRLTKDEAAAAKQFSKLKIHLERAVAKVNVFNGLSKLPRNLFPCMNDIVHMCCVLANYMNSIAMDAVDVYDDDN